jgi:hypothetical protein
MKFGRVVAEGHESGVRCRNNGSSDYEGSNSMKLVADPGYATAKGMRSEEDDSESNVMTRGLSLNTRESVVWC